MLATLPAVAAGGIYRWTEDDGKAHYGDHPPPDAERLNGGETEDDNSGFRGVERIPDGATIHLADGTEVRLIGINAPEVAHRDDPAEAGGLQALVADKRVRLAIGPEATDKYDRTLAHAFLEDGTNVAERLLATGHAFVTPRPPNGAKARAYFAVEQRARDADRGLWARPHYAVQPATEVRYLRNTFRRLRGRVATVTPKRKYVYLGFASGFRAFLQKDRTEAFNPAGKGPQALLGRTVMVRGWVRMRDGTPRMRLRHPLQIETVQ